MLKQWPKRAAPVLTAAALLLFPILVRAQSTTVIQVSTPPARPSQPAFPTLLTLPLEPAALAAVAADGFSGTLYPSPFGYYYPAYFPYFPYGPNPSPPNPNAGNFWSLAATAGWWAGQTAGPSFTSAVVSELFAYVDYIQHGYGTGRPQIYPNAGMLAIIEGSPVYPPGQLGTAELKINAPQEASISVNGKPLKWTQGWLYQSGPIGANDVQSLTIRAKWGTESYEVTRTADVVLRPGDRQSVTFIGEP